MTMPTTRGGKETRYESSVPNKSAARAQRSRSRKGIWMIGRTIDKLPCSQLPTNRQCLQKLFYLQEQTILSSNTKHLATTVASEVLNLYHAVPLTTIRFDKAAEKISRMYQKWRNLEKSRKRDSATERKKDSNLKKNSTLCVICQKSLQRVASEQTVSEPTMTRKQTYRSCVTNERDVRCIWDLLIFCTTRNHKEK